MTTREEWLALAARLEAATGPDWGLEYDLSRAIAPDETKALDKQVLGSMMAAIQNGHDAAAPGFQDKHRRAAWAGRPRYTASIDAAASAVEREFPGWLWGVTKLTDACHAAMSNRNEIGGHACQAATPALALMAALCRAKAEGAS